MSSAQDWAERQLGYRFSNPALLDEALSHRSASKKINNERLEFLGDALLGLVVADALFKTVANVDEGALSRLRASLVRGTTLAEIAREIGLDTHLNLGHGELRSGGAKRSSLLADALEAVLGAVFLDGGFDPAAQTALKLLGPRLVNLPDAESLKDPKTRLQEWLQGRGLALPDYEVAGVTGPDHAQKFAVSCMACGQSTTGSGRSRRAAEQAAAEAMLGLLTEGS